MLKNYRPVSNLPFISKILEKVVNNQLENHINSHSLHYDVQSAYRAYHSTETALLRVHHDIAYALDSNCCAVLLMLDLSAAFDTIDHQILFNRLEYSKDALLRFQSYLMDRTQRVAIWSVQSDDIKLRFGVPQGSILGPKLYCIFAKPVSEICRRHGIPFVRRWYASLSSHKTVRKLVRSFWTFRKMFVGHCWLDECQYA